MSSFTFDDILAEAAKNKGGSSGDKKESVRLNGVFNTEIEYAMYKSSKNGHPMLLIKHVVLDGPNVGDESWQSLTLLDNKYSKAAFGQFLLAVGFTGDYLRTLPLTGDAAVKASLESIAEDIVGVRLQVEVKPNTKSPDFDDWTIVSTIEGVVAPSSAPTIAAAPVAAPVAQAPVGVPVAVPGAPFIPGAGFVPQLPTS